MLIPKKKSLFMAQKRMWQGYKEYEGREIQLIQVVHLLLAFEAFGTKNISVI